MSSRIQFVVWIITVVLFVLVPVSFAFSLAHALAQHARPQPISNTYRSQEFATDQAESTHPHSERERTQREITGYHLSREKYAQAIAYSRARYRFYFLDTAYGILILLLVLWWHLAARFRDWAERGGSRSRIRQAVIYAPLLIVALSVLNLPPAIYSQWLERAYQQSVQSWSSWTLDWGKEVAISLIFGTFLAWSLYAIIRRSPRRWWLYSWLVSLPIIVFVIFIEPLVVEPLFFKFQPLESTQPVLTTEISRVVKRAGMDIPPNRMFEMKASAKLNELNAYVTGVGASKRVVVWDTTISKMTTPETLFVFGHEMGHYVLGHIWKGMVYAAAILFIFLYVGFRLFGWMLDRWGKRWEIRGADDWASLPVLLLILAIFMFIGSPAFNAFSRHDEHQADVYGLEVIHGLVPDSRQVAAQAFQVLGEVDLSDPHPSPFIRFWLYSHPPLDERLNFALHYDPWERGESPQFVK